MNRALRHLARVSMAAGALMLLVPAAYVVWAVADRGGWADAVQGAGWGRLGVGAVVALIAAISILHVFGAWSFLRGRRWGILLLCLSALAWVFLGASDLADRGASVSGILMLALGVSIGALLALQARARARAVAHAGRRSALRAVRTTTTARVKARVQGG